MTWQKCPVCEGRGSVPPGFYSGSSVATGTSTAREECRSCHGKGVLLDPVGRPNQWRVLGSSSVRPVLRVGELSPPIFERGRYTS